MATIRHYTDDFKRDAMHIPSEFFASKHIELSMYVLSLLQR